MSNSEDRDFKRRSGRAYAHFGPFIWIAVLLTFWFVVSEWRMLPEMVSATMAALP